MQKPKFMTHKIALPCGMHVRTETNRKLWELVGMEAYKQMRCRRNF